MHDTNDKLDAIGTRLDRIETKLDDHLQRVTKAESDINWIRGHLRISTAIFLAVVGAMSTTLFNLFLRK